MNIQELLVGELNTCCYILSLDDRKDCVVIDPGADAQRILEAAGSRRIAAVLLTHGHYDHMGAVRDLMGSDTELLIHPNDAAMLSNGALNASTEFTGVPVTAPSPTRTVDEGDSFTIAGITFSVLHTPGHTAGSVCYRTEEALFTGDTLFMHGWGRTDLYSGDQTAMMRSLRRLMPISRNMPYYPGHHD